MEARMQFVTLRPGVRLQCTGRHFGRECGAHVIYRRREENGGADEQVYLGMPTAFG